MKIEELFPKEGKNRKKAKKIRTIQKDRAKDNNPGETENMSGWNADPHQGTFDRMRMGIS